MIDVDLEIENLEEIARALDKIGLSPITVLEKAVMAAAEVIREEAENRAAGPIGKEILSKKKTIATAGVGPDKDHWYLRFLEFGTQPHEITPSQKKAITISDEKLAARVSHRGMAAKPFLRPAADEKEKQSIQVAGDIYWESIKKAKGSLF